MPELRAAASRVRSVPLRLRAHPAPPCFEEHLLAFSCRTRNLRASCQMRRAVLVGERLCAEIVAPVAHRHVVFTVPIVLCGLVERGRSLLGLIASLSYEATLRVMRAAGAPGEEGRRGEAVGIARAVARAGDAGRASFSRGEAALGMEVVAAEAVRGGPSLVSETRNADEGGRVQHEARDDRLDPRAPRRGGTRVTVRFAGTAVGGVIERGRRREALPSR